MNSKAYLVMFLDSKESRRAGFPISSARTANAVPKSPPREETSTAVVTSAKFSWINFRLSYI